ncbi:MAG TPA: lipid-A-disaccharide synthase, partial [Candidatus Udaeobacter sp.]|nr:lipid-A-disaccharide synthase [Candidatus Udaeobacter sp.]
MNTGAAPTLLWSAGDPSGDRHAARVVAAIRALRPDVRSLGLGGPAMAAAGVELVARLDEVAVVGLTEVLGRLGAIARVRRTLTEALAGRQSEVPALFIPVDYPGMNLLLARRAAGLGVPVVYFISPQLWAWGAGRMRGIKASVARMLVFFDFEAELYQKAAVPVTFVGHPLVEQVAEVVPRAAARAELGIPAQAQVLVLMPGSRPGEVRSMLEPMLATAAALQTRHPALQVWLRVAPGIDERALAAAARAHGLELQWALEGDPRIVRAADLALAAAGTATLETALLGTPLVIAYRVSWLTYQIARRLVRLPWIGLVNVVAGRLVAPEFIQGDLRGPAVVDAADRLLTNPDVRATQLAAFREVAARLGAP